jgi:hypothetical protein
MEVTDEMLALLREYQMSAYGELDDDCDKRMIAGLIELHEQSKPKPEPFVYYKKQPWGYDECDYGDEGSFPLYDAPPTREPLSEDEMPVGRMMVNGVLLSPDCTTAFILGVRFAEQAHGIGVINEN